MGKSKKPIILITKNDSGYCLQFGNYRTGVNYLSTPNFNSLFGGQRYLSSTGIGIAGALLSLTSIDYKELVKKPKIIFDKHARTKITDTEKKAFRYLAEVLSERAVFTSRLEEQVEKAREAVKERIFPR